MIKTDWIKQVLRNQRGFTLAELLVVVALIGVVLAIPIQGLYLTYKDWDYNRAMSSVLMSGNLLHSYLSREIRSAEKPASGEVAVEVDDNLLIIYRPSGTQWERIEYQWLDDSDAVQRGSFTGTDSQVLDRDTNPVNGWTTVASGVTSLTFEDITLDVTGNDTGDRRLIKVAMQLSDTVNGTESFQPFQVESTYLSRSQEVSSGGVTVVDDDDDTVAVTGVSVSPTSLSLREGETSTLTATVSPSDATDKTVSWSSNNPSRATVSSSGVVQAVSSGSATITVTTSDGGYTAQCLVQVTSSGGGC